MLSPFLVTFRVIKALEDCGINYLIGGSLGSSIYGIPRATLDADLVADLEHAKVQLLTEILKGDFYIDPDMIHDAIHRRRCFNIIHLETMFKVDVFVINNDDYSKEEFSRRRQEIFQENGQIMQVASPEDIILTKLLWFKEGNGVSERQWLDAKGVLTVQGDLLDTGYMDHWAKFLGIDDLLGKLRQD